MKMNACNFYFSFAVLWEKVLGCVFIAMMVAIIFMERMDNKSELLKQDESHQDASDA